MQNTMTVDIDPNFSIYHLVERVQRESTDIASRRAMSLISAEIENASIYDGADNRVFASFQVMSRFLPQARRYAQLAQTASEVYVFGIPDVPLAELPKIPNVRYVPLQENHQLAKEWFLVSYGPNYYSALATEELTHYMDPDDQRQFQGLWSFELRMVSTLHEWLCGVVGISPQMSQAQDEQQDYHNQIKLMGNTIGRLMKRIEI
jgi:DICT domain-containing protein